MISQDERWEALGRLLSAGIARRGKSVAEAARDVGLSDKHLARLVAGKPGNYRAKTLALASHAAGFPPDMADRVLTSDEDLDWIVSDSLRLMMNLDPNVRERLAGGPELTPKADGDPEIEALKRAVVNLRKSNAGIYERIGSMTHQLIEGEAVRQKQAAALADLEAELDEIRTRVDALEQPAKAATVTPLPRRDPTTLGKAASTGPAPKSEGARRSKPSAPVEQDDT